MPSASIRFGCQTYTWQMSFARYSGELGHIASVAKAAGFEGLEPELRMLGPLASKPAELKELLAKKGVELGALCLVCDWRGAKETPEEKALADSCIGSLRDFFPGSVLALCQTPGADRSSLGERRRNALSCVNEVARRAADSGVTAAFHPNSPSGSVFRTAEDYEILLAGLDASVLGFAPDAGHIAKGGMDPLKTIEGSIGLVRHVHFKDMDASGRWVEMGKGLIDFEGIVEALKNAGYKGWIMVEDESALAEGDPDAATLFNGGYVGQLKAKA